jgi:hypothetical protein
MSKAFKGIADVLSLDDGDTITLRRDRGLTPSDNPLMMGGGAFAVEAFQPAPPKPKPLPLEIGCRAVTSGGRVGRVAAIEGGFIFFVPDDDPERPFTHSKPVKVLGSVANPWNLKLYDGVVDATIANPKDRLVGTIVEMSPTQPGVATVKWSNGTIARALKDLRPAVNLTPKLEWQIGCTVMSQNDSSRWKVLGIDGDVFWARRIGLSEPRGVFSKGHFDVVGAAPKG